MIRKTFTLTENNIIGLINEADIIGIPDSELLRRLLDDRYTGENMSKEDLKKQKRLEELRAENRRLKSQDIDIEIKALELENERIRENKKRKVMNLNDGL